MVPSNLEILAYEMTSLGDLCLRRRELLSRPGTVITEITLDHQLLMSSYNTVSERAFSCAGWVSAIPRPRCYSRRVYGASR